MIIPKLYQSGKTDSPGAINYSKKNYLSNEFALQGTNNSESCVNVKRAVIF